MQHVLAVLAVSQTERVTEFVNDRREPPVRTHTVEEVEVERHPPTGAMAVALAPVNVLSESPQPPPGSSRRRVFAGWARNAMQFVRSAHVSTTTGARQGLAAQIDTASSTWRHKAGRRLAFAISTRTS